MRSSGMMVTSASGRAWHARRTFGPALMPAGIQFGLLCPAELGLCGEDDHAASRAAPASAADRHVRNAVLAADLEQRGTGLRIGPAVPRRTDRQVPGALTQDQPQRDEGEEKQHGDADGRLRGRPDRDDLRLSRSIGPVRVRPELAKVSGLAIAAFSIRPCTATPQKAAKGISTAAARRTGAIRRYQLVSRSQKWMPMQPCTQTSRRSSVWASMVAGQIRTSSNG